MSVYFLQYDDGEYSDRTQRIVAAYFDHDCANRHCDKANEWLKERHFHFDNHGTILDYDTRHDGQLCPYDPEFDGVDYTGANYTVGAVPLLNLDALPMMDGIAANRRPDFADWLRDNGWDEQTATKWQH